MRKLVTVLMLSGFFLGGSLTLNAETGHDHSLAGGPKGGRLLENTEPRAEFFVEKDKSVTITFYDSDLKPVPAEGQSVLVISEENGVKTELEFEKKNDVFVSKGKLPEGHAPKLVVQFKQTPEAKPINFRFTVEDHICPVCKRAEYACICGH